MMKKIWARVGMTYEMSEKQYAELSDAYMDGSYIS